MYKLHLSSHNLDSKGIFGLKMLFLGGFIEVCESFIKIKTKPSMPVRTERPMQSVKLFDACPASRASKSPVKLVRSTIKASTLRWSPSHCQISNPPRLHHVSIATSILSILRLQDITMTMTFFWAENWRTLLQVLLGIRAISSLQTELAKC